MINKLTLQSAINKYHLGEIESVKWTIKDNTLSADMKTYRQALRDVPKQTDPDNITWPSKPS